MKGRRKLNLEPNENWRVLHLKQWCEEHSIELDKSKVLTKAQLLKIIEETKTKKILKGGKIKK